MKHLHFNDLRILADMLDEQIEMLESPDGPDSIFYEEMLKRVEAEMNDFSIGS
jgi:hypothetical protein